MRRGESPSISEYADAHPDFADEIRELFPSVQMIEQLATRREQQRISKKAHKTNVADPEQLGDYRIIRRIGQGGMGIVYEAVHETLDRRVAVKMLPPQMAASERHVARFVREAKAAARLHHTNIVPVFGVGEDDGTFFYVMQLIDGTGLDCVLNEVKGRSRGTVEPATTIPLEEFDKARDSSSEIAARLLSNDAQTIGKLDEGSSTSTPTDRAPLSLQYFRRMAEVGAKVANALQFAHEHDVLHRDIKPANILIDTEGDVWVSDFGLAKLTDAGSVTASGDFVGTLRYVAPESFRGETDARSDVYSLGVTLYELIALRPAFDDDNRSSLMRRIMDEEPSRLRSIDSNIPRDLETIVCKATSKDVHARYQSAGELAEDLERFLNDLPIKARRISSLERLRRWSRRNPMLATLTTTSLVLLIAVTLLSTYGYVHLRWAYNRVDEALTEARESEGNAIESQKQAEANLRIALRAFDEISDNLASRELPRSIQIDLPDGTLMTPMSGLSAADAKLVKSLLKFYDEFAGNNAGETVLDISTANVHQRIGDIYTRLGDYDAAIDAYERTLSNIPAHGGDVSKQVELAMLRSKALNSLGVALLQGGRFLHSIESHEKALKLLDSHQSNSGDDAQFRFELANTLNHLIHARITLFINRQSRRGPWRPNQPGDRVPLPQIDSEQQRALDLLIALVEKFPQNVDYRRALAQCHRNVLPVAWAKSDDHLASEAKSKSVAILRSLADEFPDKPQFQFDLADTLAMTKYTDVAKPSPLTQGDVEDLLESATLARQLHEQFPTALEYSFLLANTHHKLGSYFIASKEWLDAKPHLTTAARLFESLVMSVPTNAIFQGELARIRWKLGEGYRRDGSLEESRETLSKAISDYEEFRQTKPRRKIAIGLLVSLYRQLARTLQEVGEPDLAAEANEEAENLRRRSR